MFDLARTSHLSDEAVAAYADDVLTGQPRERARRHVAECAECRYAVAVQREAVLALRRAAAPSLPSGLIDRLRDVPLTTPVHRVPESVDDNGTPLFAGFGAAAFVPASSGGPQRRSRTLAIGAASVVVVSAVAGIAAAAAAEHHPAGPAHPASPPAHVRGSGPQLVGPQFTGPRLTGVHPSGG